MDLEGRCQEMRIERADTAEKKGWYAGPWNSELPVSIGYASAGVDEPHKHQRITEIYLVGRGCSQIRVNRDTLTLVAGDMLLVEPGEAHTFLESTPDYFHFVIQVPGLAGDVVAGEKIAVPREQLGLSSFPSAKVS
jgi:mannose-6-phosphate isomerase-like protein (cupin superfamily)